MQPFGMFGGAEVIIIALFYSGVGVPLGVPPEEPDTLLLRVAPEECLYYTTWAGMATPDPKSKNETERLLAEPEIRTFIKELETRIDLGFAKLAEEADSPEEQFAAELAPLWLKTLITRPTAVFVSDMKINADGPPDMKAGAVVNTGANTIAIRDSILKLQAQHLEGKVEEVEISGTKCYRFQVDKQAPVVTWGIRGKYLLVGLGDGSIEEIFKNAVTAPPAWLGQMQEDLQVERVSTLTHADLRGGMQMIVDAVKQFEPDDPEVAKMDAVIAALGLNSLTNYQAVSGLDGDGFVTRTMIGSDDELTGILKLLEAKPLTDADVAPIPGDSTVAAALKLDSREVLRIVESVGKEIDPRFGDQIDEGLRSIEELIGVDLKGEVMEGLGDTWCLYTSPNEGGSLFTGWTATVNVRDYGKAKKAYDQLVAIAAETMKHNDDDDFGLDEWERRWRRRSQPILNKIQHGEHTIYYVTQGNGMPFAPCWCLTETHLIGALYPQSIQSLLSRGEGYESIATTQGFEDLLNAADPPLMLSYYDSQAVFEMYYPMLLMFAQFGFAEMEREIEGLTVDVSMLPSVKSISPHLRPAGAAVRRTAGGIEFINKQSLPGASTGSTAPIMVALLLPAIQAAREAARRNASINNLRQIGLAMLNHETATKRFPAQALKTKEGKPGLSWRVAILPYIEEEALYEEFRLDEPWDSEHNIKLLERMPMAYRSPKSEAEPGHTTYLAVTGKSGAIQGVGREEATRVADIRDGMSNTILALEVNDEHAVPWTKPDDWEPDDMKVFKGLDGVWSGDVFLAVFCDCHTRSISLDVDPEVFSALLTRDGGEDVREWQLDGDDDFGDADFEGADFKEADFGEEPRFDPDFDKPDFEKIEEKLPDLEDIPKEEAPFEGEFEAIEP